MLVVDLLFGESLGTSSPYIVLAFYLQHLAANISWKDRNAGCCTQDGWNKEVPDPVHEPARQGGISNPESLHANHRDVKAGYHEYDKNVGEEETGNGD